MVLYYSLFCSSAMRKHYYVNLQWMFLSAVNCAHVLLNAKSIYKTLLNLEKKCNLKCAL